MIKRFTFLAQACSWLAVLATLGMVFLFLGFLGVRGFDTLNLSLFFGNTPPWEAITGRLPVWHGIWPACVGTVALILLSSLLAIPLGLASGIYLACYASGSWKRWFSPAVELLAGIPSILMGLFGLAVILGRSGSGKTTFLRTLNRLNECFPGSATRGGVKLKLQGEWREIYQDALPLPELRRRVGMVFQTPHLLPESIADNLALPVKLVLGLPRRDIASRVEWALKEAHLWEEVKDRLEAPAHTLSGGQQQRLCLARLLALEPEILLLDEPTASLDFRAALKVEELLLSLKERYTVIAVSHSLSQARRLADEALIFRDGSVVQQLSREDLQAPDTLQALLEEIF